MPKTLREMTTSKELSQKLWDKYSEKDKMLVKNDLLA